jgi:protein-L-isoaspartate(D-aspartate) O-methyltransferase
MAEDLAGLREALARSVAGQAGPAVADALAAVPRHLFLPGVPAERAYSDQAVVTKRDETGLALSSSSQPALMAVMLAQLALAPGQRVLEIGAGTGYNAALIRHIVGPSGAVISIDIDQDTVGEARAHLAAAGYPDVTVLCRDGAEGAAEHAPFDRLIATVGLSDLSPAWLAQLNPGARMVVPIEVRGPMLCVAFERQDGYWASRSLEPCGFIKVRGALAGSSPDVMLAEGLSLRLPARRDVDAAGLVRALADGPASTLPTGVTAGTPTVMWGLYPWLCGGEPRACSLGEERAGGRAARLPQAPVNGPGLRVTYGLVSGRSIALVSGSEGEELTVAGYGEGAAELLSSLALAVGAWDAAGRPGTEGLHVDAYPPAADVPSRAGFVIDRPSTRFAVYRT